MFMHGFNVSFHFKKTYLLKSLVNLAPIIFLVSCSGSGDNGSDIGSGGGGGSDVPGISISAAELVEGDTGATNMVFTLTLSASAENITSVDFSTADGSATSVDSDYVAVSSTLNIPTGDTSANISVSIPGDTQVENNEYFIINLSNPLGLTITSGSVNGLIISNEPAPINDTGIQSCASQFNSNTTCPQDGFPGQDAERGRDVTHNDSSDGDRGFSFTQLDATGLPLTTKSDNYLTTPWSCVRDNVTGLIWEIKTRSAGLRNMTHTYSWFNSSSIENGGNAGGANAGNCFDSTNCDTEKYVAQVNAANLCGYSDWRMPKREELRSISNISSSTIDRAVDLSYFANTQPSHYWASEPVIFNNLNAWQFNYNKGDAEHFDKPYSFYVQLVRP